MNVGDRSEQSSTVLAVSKPELVTLALGEVGGAREPIDTEDVALKAHELAPTAFAWRRYPDHINLELVRVALVDASRPKSGAMVQGRGRGGWVLTDAGVTWLALRRLKLLEALGRSTSSGGARVKQPETQHRERERIRVTRLDAWRKWSLDSLVTDAEASAVFRVDQYTTPNTRVTKIRTLRDLFADDYELGRFVNAMAAQITPVQPPEEERDV